jgi:tetratricopeptide (TPR) repeat protein
VGLRAVWSDAAVLRPPFRPLPAIVGASERSRVLLLSAEFGVVPYYGREAELDVLSDWAVGPARIGVRLLRGSGGSGKTRLAAETAHRLAARGWVSGFLAKDADADAGAVRRLVRLTHSRLVIIDDADGDRQRVALLAGLLDQFGNQPHPIRILLIARAPGDWWRTLQHQYPWLLDADSQEVQPLLSEDRRGLYQTAFVAYSRTLACSAASDSTVDLDTPTYDEALFVLIEALRQLSVVCADAGQAETAPRDGAQPAREARAELLDWVLDEELRRIWQPTIPAGLGADNALLERVVTIASLAAADTEIEAAARLALLPELADAPAHTRHQWVRWVHDLYPGRGYLHPLRPDLLAEQLVARTIGDMPDLPAQLLDHPSATQAARTLGTLAAAAVHPQVEHALKQALQRWLPDLVNRLIVWAQEPDALTTVSYAAELEASLHAAPVPESAAELDDPLPQGNYLLAGLAATMAEQVVGHIRALAKADPATYTPYLAQTINNLATRYRDAGRHDDAGALSEEATRLYRALAQADPSTYSPKLAGALSNLAVHYELIGRGDDAVGPAEEATHLYRPLAEADPSAYTPHLALALNALANAYGAVGRLDDAVGLAEEVLRLYFDLTTTVNFVLYQPSLAGAFHNVAVRYCAVGRYAEAVWPAESAASLYRVFAKTNPGAHTPNLAMALGTVALCYADVGRYAEAVGAAEESVRLYRSLTEANPTAYTRDLADALTRLAYRYSEAGQHDQAVSATDEATRVRKYAEIQ